MTPRITKRDGRRGYEPLRRMTFRTITLWTLALVLALVVVTNLQVSGVDAATQLQHDHEPRLKPLDDGGGLDPVHFCEAPAISGGHGMAEVWSAEMEHAIGPGSVTPDAANDPEMAEVWSSEMMVGRAADSANPIQVYTGYFPLGSEHQGSLDDTTFTVNGMDYEVSSMFEQQFGANFQQLVFEASEPLPDDLTLEIDNDQFRASASRRLGARGNIHAWTLEQSLGWEEGAIMPVAPMELPEPDPSPGPICNTVALE